MYPCNLKGRYVPHNACCLPYRVLDVDAEIRHAGPAGDLLVELPGGGARMQGTGVVGKASTLPASMTLC